MSRKQDVARRFRLRRLLTGSLALGGFFNLALGILVGLAPDLALGILQLPRPTPGFYLELLATLAALIGCYYILASSDVRRYAGMVALAIVGRAVVGLTLVLIAARQPELRGLGALAVVELAFATAHAISWWSIRR